MTMTLGRALPLILVASALSLADAAAQNLPWPGEAPAAPAGAPAQQAPAPMPMPMMAPPPPMQAGPPQQQQQGGPSQQCVTEFTELRMNVEMLAANARAAGERKVAREEMCKVVQLYATAEAKWVKFTVDNVVRCGIPPDLPKKLREVHAKTQVARKNICSAGPAGPAGPAAPSLSDALGTTRLPVPDGSQSGRGTLDTLTGNAIAR